MGLGRSQKSRDLVATAAKILEEILEEIQPAMAREYENGDPA